MFRKIISVLFLMGVFASVAMAADEGTAAHVDAYRSLGAAIAIGVAAFGGSLGQGKAAAAALDGISRNPAAQPKIFVPMIISLALIESLVLYAFVIAFRIL